MLFCKKFIEAFIPVINTFFHSSLDHAISIRDRLKDGMNRGSCPVTGQFLESHGVERDVSSFGESFKFKCLHHQLFRHLMEHAMKSELISILVLVNVTIFTATLGPKWLSFHF